MRTDIQRSGFAELRQLGTHCTVPRAGEFFGIGRSRSYQLSQAGQFPVAVKRLGRRDVVLVADLARALGLDPRWLLDQPADHA